MKPVLYFAAMAIVSSAVSGYGQESKKEPGNAHATKATYMVMGLHCPPCTTTVEQSLRKAKGIGAVKLDFEGKYATVVFDESLISAQEVAGAVSSTPHMMGRNLRYGSVLVLSVPGVEDKTTALKATTALSSVAGVVKVTLFPAQEAVRHRVRQQGKGDHQAVD